jgi:hypothetical protein
VSAPALEERLTIGRTVGPEEVTFARITDLTVSSLGDIWVVDAPAHAVKVYDPSGNVRFVRGRAGEGPGEFRRPAQVVATDSSVRVFDPAVRRVTEYSNDGRLLDAQSVAGVDGLNITVFRSLAAGTALVRTTPRLSYGNDHHEPRVVVGLRRTGPAGPRVDTLLHYHSGAVVHHPEGRTLPWGVASSPFGPAGAVAIRSDSLVAVVDGYAARVSLYEVRADGAVRSMTELALPLESRPVEEEDVEAFRKDFVDRRESPLSYDPVFETPPRWSVGTDALFASDGRLWIQNGRSSTCSSVWTIVDPGTGKTERVLLPDGFRLMRVDGGTLFGVVRSDLDVPFVRLYERADG